MGWSIGYDDKWRRDIGYGVPAICDHPDCIKKIDRGLSYVCGWQEPYGGDEGCGLYFCHDHGGGTLCAHCEKGIPGLFEAKPDMAEWINHKLTDPSWETWRHENPVEVADLTARITAQHAAGGNGGSE
jgi:hypothetical protein